MMSPKKLVKKLAATRTRSVAEKGHFVAYTTDCERFVLPLTFLCNPILQALLAVSEEEYGLPGNGPIMLPCDGASMEYLISLTQRSLSEDLQKALLVSITTDGCLTSSLVQQELIQHISVFSC
ncbi:auxin-responsive protein SAUR67-like [Aristolochia californica]|uniref:auxin-responsive protein SAUR67-like n=1 Tax=Aristolochia californica TaxID=171875 RepID=UPI0035D7BFD5